MLRWRGVSASAARHAAAIPTTVFGGCPAPQLHQTARAPFATTSSSSSVHRTSLLSRLAYCSSKDDVSLLASTPQEQSARRFIVGRGDVLRRGRRRPAPASAAPTTPPSPLGDDKKRSTPQTMSNGGESTDETTRRRQQQPPDSAIDGEPKPATCLVAPGGGGKSRGADEPTDGDKAARWHDEDDSELYADRVSSTTLARRWRETATAALHGRRRPAISRAFDLIRKQRPVTSKENQPDDAVSEGEDAADVVADLLSQEHQHQASSATPSSASSGGRPATATQQTATSSTTAARHKSTLRSDIGGNTNSEYGGLKAFRESLSSTQVSDALRDASLPEDTAAPTNGVVPSGQAAYTPHERHRRHLLSHVDITFALRTLRIHVFVLDNGTEWIDVYLGSNAAQALRHTKPEGVEPSDEEIVDVYHAAIAVLLQEHQVHDTLIEDAMERVLVPQAVLLEDSCALVLRCVNPEASSRIDSLAQLTSRLTVFLLPGKVITLHRRDLPSVQSIRRRFDDRFRSSSEAHLLNALVYGCLQTFRRELTRATVEFDGLESKLFDPQEMHSHLARELYAIKRRGAMCARVVHMMAESYSHAAGFLRVGTRDGYYQDVIHEFSQIRTSCEELNESAHNVMQLLFQLSSFQLNELMRVLTMFSAFFIPLTFIAGLYGMNFDHMPLVKDDFGAWYCAAFMGAVGASVLLWFRLRGF